MAEPFGGKTRLEGGKDIAAYLNREVRTVQRWEKNEGLPIHRQMHEHRAEAAAGRRHVGAIEPRHGKHRAGICC